MKRILLTLVLIGLCIPLSADINERSEKHGRVTALINQFLSNYHYKKVRLKNNDELSADILDRYLENLDPNRSFFLSTDIRAFSRYRHTLDDSLRDADTGPAFKVFEVFKERLVDRVAHAKRLLKRDFDFSVDEEYLFDRSEAPWAANQAELDEIWRKRVKNDVLGLRLAAESADEIVETLEKRYERLANRGTQLETDEVYQLFINAYTASIEPHTTYFSPRNSEEFEIRMSLSLEGIGAVLRTDNEFTVVQEVIAGGPAQMSDQLHPGDRIVGVGQGRDGEVEDVVGWRLDDVVDLIRGPKGTIVRLKLLPKETGVEGESEVIILTRNKINLEDQAAQKSVIDIPSAAGARIGVITLPAFYLDFGAKQRGEKNYRSTTRDVKRLLAELEEENIDGLVIDLRDNGGGSLTEATSLTGLFIESGPIVQVRDAAGRIEIYQDPDKSIAYSGPMAVLVNRFSASASEIFAGALQDYQRAIVIGEPTFGKGTVQSIVDLGRFAKGEKDGLGQLKATIAQFFRVSGSSTQHKGVTPDIVYPTAVDVSEHGERSVDNALPWDEVPATSFKPSKAPIGRFNDARGQHMQRIGQDPGFRFLLAESAAVRLARDRTSVSLLESRRKAERDRLEKENRERENTLRISLGLEPLVDSENEEEEEFEPEDALLNEAAHILHDLIGLSGGPAAPKVAGHET
ncbi:MAG: carboxy terminal-processing peptidase [Gammaproteobacteria bacterium]